MTTRIPSDPLTDSGSGSGRDAAPPEGEDAPDDAQDGPPPRPTRTQPRSRAIFWAVVGAAGKLSMLAGIVLLLFVAYQLWGTGLLTDRAQDDLEAQYVERIEQTRTEDGVDAPPEEREVPSAGDVFGLSPEDQAEFLETTQPGQAAGQIDIPAIGSNWTYVQDVDLSYLRDGPGHFPTTSWPGQEGNAALAGHRTTYGAPFHRLDELEPGDTIEVSTIQGVFEYEVVPRGDLAGDMPIADTSDPNSGHFIIQPGDTWILDDYGDDRLTLMACHPKYSASQRIVTVAQLKGPAKEPTPPADVPEASESTLVSTELLGNDSEATGPAIAWGVATAAVLVLAWAIGKRWGRAKWPVYAAAVPVFIVLLFVTFTYVERLLPAAY